MNLAANVRKDCRALSTCTSEWKMLSRVHGLHEWKGLLDVAEMGRSSRGEKRWIHLTKYPHGSVTDLRTKCWAAPSTQQDQTAAVFCWWGSKARIGQRGPEVGQR